MNVEIAGRRVMVVPSWLSGYAFVDLGRPARPPPRGKRKGTRRQWKRAHPFGWRRRWVHIEPDHMMTTTDAIYCTATQYRTLRRDLDKLPAAKSPFDGLLGGAW